MSYPADSAPTAPALSPKFCLNTTALRDFLRLSRTTVDDSISAHLNGLIHPSRGAFTPASPPPVGARSRQNVPAPACAQFAAQVLFPSWRARDNVLTYCARVAEAPVEAAPAPAGTPGADDGRGGPRMNTNYWGLPTVVDERTDPYSARDYSYARQTKVEELRTVLQNERGVEKIVRSRTWSVLVERCVGGAAGIDSKGGGGGDDEDAGWEGAYGTSTR